MPNTLRLFLVPLGIFAYFSNANANGINPPRVSGSEIVEATCTSDADVDSTIIFRARVVAGEKATDLMEIRMGNEPALEVSMSKINRLEIASSAPDPDGFVRANLHLSDPEYQGKGFVKVIEQGKPLRLSGFTKVNRRVEIPLSKCKALLLRTVLSEAVEHRPAVKK